MSYSQVIKLLGVEDPATMRDIREIMERRDGQS